MVPAMAVLVVVAPDGQRVQRRPRRRQSRDLVAGELVQLHGTTRRRRSQSRAIVVAAGRGRRGGRGGRGACRGEAQLEPVLAAPVSSAAAGARAGRSLGVVGGGSHDLQPREPSGRLEVAAGAGRGCSLQLGGDVVWGAVLLKLAVVLVAAVMARQVPPSCWDHGIGGDTALLLMVTSAVLRVSCLDRFTGG